jgi:beta-N-acetylhexosaminidase
MQMLFMRIFCVFLCLLSLTACVKRETAVNEESNEINTVSETIDPARLSAREAAASLDDRLLAAQIIICGIDGRGSLPPHMKSLLEECPAGGVMLFKYNLNTENSAIRNLIGEIVSLIFRESCLPPFVAVDHEGGNVNRFLPGVAVLPAAFSYWELSLERGRKEALAKIEEDSLRAGIEINELGINLNFAPVVEFLYDGNRDFLASRSYGFDPSFTFDAAAAFVHTMEQSGVLSVVKHFPASAGVDPHYSASLLDLNKTALDVLVSPFVSLFENGARAVMVAHTAVPAIDNKIASLSQVVMKDWLRDELGFDGIIICDDFSMAAAGSQTAEDAAVQSIAAGADMILVWPPDLIRTYRAILFALEDGRLSRERLTDAAERIIYEKIRMKLTDGE